MKKQISALLFVAGLAGLVSSCGDDNDAQRGSIDDLSVEAKSFLLLKAGSSKALNDSRNSAINMSFQGFFGGRKGGRIAGDTTDTWPDTTIIISPDVPECAQQKYSEFPGGYTSSVDYGEGCDLSWGDFKYIVFGKYSNTYRWSYSQNGSAIINEFENEAGYENYGAHYESDSTGQHTWSMDGQSNYSGTSSYDSLNSKFNGSFSHRDETTYQYDADTYSYFSEGTSAYDDKKWELTTNTYRYTEGQNYYESVVLKPLVYKYSCSIGIEMAINVASTYVSGREQITYKQGPTSGTFIIDYGKGACDNVITIIENGKEITIDLGKEWAELEKGG